MMPQHFTKGRQHIQKGRMPFVFVPRHCLRQQRRFSRRTIGVPCLYQTHQDHCQRSLSIDGLTAPAVGGLKSHKLFCLQNTFFNSPAVVIPLNNLFIRHGRIRAKEKVIFFLSRWVSNDDHSNRNSATHMIPQADDTQHHPFYLIALLLNRYFSEAFFSIGRYLFRCWHSFSLFSDNHFVKLNCNVRIFVVSFLKANYYSIFIFSSFEDEITMIQPVTIPSGQSSGTAIEIGDPSLTLSQFSDSPEEIPDGEYLAYTGSGYAYKGLNPTYRWTGFEYK